MNLLVLHKLAHYIVWKYAFLLQVLNKNENVIDAGYWILSENRKN